MFYFVHVTCATTYYIITVYNIIYNIIYSIAIFVDGRKSISPAEVAIVHVKVFLSTSIQKPNAAC